jgi:hypothetical protein
VSALSSYRFTGFKRTGNNNEITGKAMLPQEDGTEIFWGVTENHRSGNMPKSWIGDPDYG